VTLSLLELVQFEDMFRLIVVYWVEGMNWIENITTINRTLLSRHDRLPVVPQALSVFTYVRIVNEWNRPFCRISHRLIYSSSSTRRKETEGSL
jgi:hypothetical protein